MARSGEAGVTADSGEMQVGDALNYVCSDVLFSFRYCP